MQLFYHPLSGHSHRVRLLLSLLNVPVELVLVDIMKGEQRRPEFLKLNKFGQVPVLDDDGLLVSDSNAILVYLARKFNREDWLPQDPIGAAQTEKWFSAAAGEVAYGLATARRIRLFGTAPVPTEVLGRAHRLLTVLDTELETSDWLAAGRLTLADISLYAYVARADEGGIDLTDYPHVQSWLGRIEALPHFVPFVKTPASVNASYA